MQDLNVSQLTGEGQTTDSHPDYQGCIDAAQPQMANLALGSRLLLIVPDDTDVQKVRERVRGCCDDNVTIVRSHGGDLIACRECEMLDIRRVATTLIGNRQDFVDIARRLHTRVDVQWKEM